MRGEERLIFALDTPCAEKALHWVERLRGSVGAFKVGLELFTSEGPGLVRDIIGQGERVFLDLKFHDIPTTMAGAARAGGRMGAFLVNVHALAGRAAMARAAEAARAGAEAVGLRPPNVIAVTVLTSHGSQELGDMGIAGSPVDVVLRLAASAREAGLDGVVASPEEVPALRHFWPEAQIVTPGVRPAGAEPGDQVRVSTPTRAVLAGADYLVVGRPIREANDPAEAARAIAREITRALETNPG